MKKRRWREKIALFLFLFSSTAMPKTAKADFFGGDLPLLAGILAQAIQQLAQLQQIMGAGRDTLGLMRDVNAGMREAMGIMRTMNRTFNPGVLSQYQTPEQMLRAIQELYGAIPQTPEARIQSLTDQSVAEAVTLHNQAFHYADQVDPEAERIKDYSRVTSPAGSARLTAQSLGVLIHVTNQVLRTNAAMLKIMSQKLALQNRHEKVNSEQFKMQYDGLSSAMITAPSFSASTSLSKQ